MSENNEKNINIKRNLNIYNSIDESIADSELIVVLTEWDEFKSIKTNKIDIKGTKLGIGIERDMGEDPVYARAQNTTNVILNEDHVKESSPYEVMNTLLHEFKHGEQYLQSFWKNIWNSWTFWIRKVIFSI